jgi:predicted nucleic acid-binding protein
VPVVDASVVVEWVAPGADRKLPELAVLDRLVAEEAEIMAPRLLIEEVSNALLTALRRGRISGQRADAAHQVLRGLPIRLVDRPEDLRRAWELARRYDNHPIYDLLYVALAQRRRTQLVTADARLRRTLTGIDWVVSPAQFAG